ncbi:dolichol kinase [Synechococcus sp. PCC 7502]|uniref:diacylglycerol/polyprenol kinase family protein n=1 Tax=Synechococcus sp. PCC 7502 TaxID=1173263 RepID=UPI00029F9E7E|nr:diacylglycerol/polyprenol kinase family protein [Synechococcus sp. PCC 7502]AFY74104.1 dolichol kinase [Synechococcus sp. PCC 7502]
MPDLISSPFPLWLQVGAIAIWLGGVLLIAEILRQWKGESELVRKVVHIGTGNIIVLAWGLGIPLWVCLIACVSFCIITYISYHQPILPMLNSVGRKTLGVFYYAVSITCLVVWFWSIKLPEYAVVGVLVMAWGDGLAALIGQKWGKHPYLFMDSKKTWEGSLAMLVTSYIVTVVVLAIAGQFSWLIPLPVAIVATLFEAISPGGTDNLTVPLGSGFLCYGLSMMAGIVG